MQENDHTNAKQTEFEGGPSPSESGAESAPAFPEMVVHRDGACVSTTIMWNYPDREAGLRLLMDAVGTDDLDFFRGLMEQINSAVSERHNKDGALKFIFSVIKERRPRNQFEAMLAAQTAIMHFQTMSLSGVVSEISELTKHVHSQTRRRKADLEEIPNTRLMAQMDSLQRAMNQCGRTFLVQIETLERMQAGREQNATHRRPSSGPDKAAGSPVHADGAKVVAMSKRTKR